MFGIRVITESVVVEVCRATCADPYQENSVQQKTDQRAPHNCRYPYNVEAYPHPTSPGKHEIWNTMAG